MCVNKYNDSFIYTLNPNIILRKSNKEYCIYDIRTDNKYVISFYLYIVLKLFQLNCTNFKQIEYYFELKKIPNSFIKIKKEIEEKKELKDLLIISDKPSKNEDIYRKIKCEIDQFYEFTPENIDLLITNKCNLKCPHCYRNSTNKDKLNKINLERLYSFFDEMEELNICSFKITGGEPFLCPELYDIISYASKKRLGVSVLTNATIYLNKKWLTLLQKENINLGISLDGVSSLTHDVIRGKGSFEKTIKNLYNFSKNNIKYSLTFTINNLNKNEINDVVELVKNKLKNGKLTFNFVEKNGRAKSSDDIFSLSKTEISELKKKIEIIIVDNPSIAIIVVDNNQLETKEEELNLIKEKSDLIFCKAGHSMLAIDSNLNVYPCIYGIGGIKEYPVANLMDDSLINIWNNSSKLDIFRGKLHIQDLPICSSCKLKEKCNLKHCRLRSIYEGGEFTDPVSFCNRINNVE